MPPPADTGLAYTPPDGQWGWAVVFGAFISIGFSYAFPKGIAIFYKEIQDFFDTSYSEIAWVSSIMLAATYGGECEMNLAIVRINCHWHLPKLLASNRAACFFSWAAGKTLNALRYHCQEASSVLTGWRGMEGFIFFAVIWSLAVFRFKQKNVNEQMTAKDKKPSVSKLNNLPQQSRRDITPPVCNTDISAVPRRFHIYLHSDSGDSEDENKPPSDLNNSQRANDRTSEC